MGRLFLTILNMSLTASYVILFIILIRLLLKKAPKVISYAIWSVVAFRLIIPFSFESVFSLMPRNTNIVPIPHDIIYQQSPQINSGIEAVDSFVSQSLPAPTVGASVNPLQIYTEIGAYIWVLGIIAFLVYSLVSILILKRQLKNAQLIEQNIFEAKNLKTPFMLGLISPKIYLPIGLNATQRSYILVHEQTHIHRKDHIIKILAFLILSVHWFNPLVWIAFMLMSTDMELSCDEKVLKEMNGDIKKPYANSLLSLATGGHILNGSPLAFGEGNVKGRIKNVLNYKKPKFWVLVSSIIIVVAVGMGLMANPMSSPSFNGSSYRVKEILYQAPMYSFGYTLDTSPQYSISSDYQLYSKQITDEDWIMHKGLYPYKISRQELYSLFNPLNNKAHEAIDQAKLIYRADTNDYNQSFYLVIQLKNGDVLLAIGYDNEDNSLIRWLFRLDKLSDSNGEIVDINSNTRDANIDDQITGFARELINKDIANYESNPEVNIIDSKITRLELIETFDKLADAPIDVYALEYRLLPEDLSKVVLAGGMDVDEDGWLKETCSMGRPLIVTLRNHDPVELVGILWTGEVSGKLGLEPAIKSLLETTALVPTAPELSPKQDLGVSMPELDYASDDIVIFHGYFGLFVYDLNTLQIIRSIDLKPLNCQQTQGSNACDVSVSVDGNTVHLHPMESENMYIYTVSSHTLQEAPYQRMEKRFSSVPIEDVIDSTRLGIYSYNAARFDTGEYGYLRTSDWTLGTLSYVRGDMMFRLFSKWISG